MIRDPLWYHVRAAVTTARRWEDRKLRWHARYGDNPAHYEKARDIYRHLGDAFAAMGYSSLQALRYGPDGTPERLREVAERIAGQQLLPLQPEDAIAFGRESIFEAEDWYLATVDLD